MEQPNAMNRRRVLLTSQSGQLGGMELRLADEARFLASVGYEPTLAISPFPGIDPWLHSLREEGLRLADFDPPPFFEEWSWRRVNFVRARMFSQRRLARLAPSLVHVAYAWTQTGGSRLWLSHKCGIPSVISVHNFFPSPQLSPWHHRLTTEAFRSVQGIYGVSESALQRFCEGYEPYILPTTVLRTINNFVDVRRFFPSPQRRNEGRRLLEIPPDAPVIGSIGRLDMQKEPLAAARIFRRVFNAVPEAYFVFVGQGPLADATRQEVQRLGFAERVRFTGFRRDVESLYPVFDIHILLSRLEGFGISTAEAMACGVPVVATNVPGTQEVLAASSAGVLVRYGAEDETVQALTFLLSDPQRRSAMSEAGRESAVARFSRERWAASIQDFYQQVMS
jgi:glycosyltransferase involved in cell wall biosynthesis